MAAHPRTWVSAKLAREMTCSVAALACFGQKEGNGTEKEDVGMVGWAEWKSCGRRIAGQGRGRPRLGRLQ